MDYYLVTFNGAAGADNFDRNAALEAVLEHVAEEIDPPEKRASLHFVGDSSFVVSCSDHFAQALSKSPEIAKIEPFQDSQMRDYHINTMKPWPEDVPLAELVAQQMRDTDEVLENITRFIQETGLSSQVSALEKAGMASISITCTPVAIVKLKDAQLPGMHIMTYDIPFQAYTPET
jgi:hypothetical protein